MIFLIDPFVDLSFFHWSEVRVTITDPKLVRNSHRSIDNTLEKRSNFDPLGQRKLLGQSVSRTKVPGELSPLAAEVSTPQRSMHRSRTEPPIEPSKL